LNLRERNDNIKALRVNLIIATVLLSTIASFTSTALAQGTAFTYQGQLGADGSPANGEYDLQFTIYGSTNIPGILIGTPVTNFATPVSNGLFQVALNFGPEVFTGPPLWLEIGVRTNAGSAFTSLNPRQPLLSVPYAVTANSASNLLGTIEASQVSGTLPALQLPVASASALGVVQGDGQTITISASGVESVAASALTGVSAALATNLAGGATITNLYPFKRVAANYTVTTNDRVIFSSAATNTIITLPAAPPPGIMFTIFNKGTGLVTVTNNSSLITIPGLGNSAFAVLGPWTSPSNTLTVTFDGSNY
jgi:hypothetical protein